MAQRGLTQPVQCGKYTLLPGGHSGRGASKNDILLVARGDGSSVNTVDPTYLQVFYSFLGSCHLGEDAKFLLSWYGGGVRRMLPNRCIDQEI